MLLDSPEANWSEIAERALETKTALPAQVMIVRTEATIGPMKAGVLVDDTWRRAVARAGVLWPAYRGSEQVLRGAFIFRATRPSTPSSLGALVTGLPWDVPSRLRKRRAAIRKV
jgi:hypothetical protein